MCADQQDHPDVSFQISCTMTLKGCTCTAKNVVCITIYSCRQCNNGGEKIASLRYDSC